MGNIEYVNMDADVYKLNSCITKCLLGAVHNSNAKPVVYI